MTLTQVLEATIRFLEQQCDTQASQDIPATRACIAELKAWREWVTYDVEVAP